MILLDANLLIYSFSSSSPHYQPAHQWLESLLSSPRAVALAWGTINAFLRISTNPRAYAQPYTAPEAVQIVSDLLERPTVQIVNPGASYWRIFRELLVEAQGTANLVNDAHLAALAIEHGALLCTTDRDFSRFPGLRWENPLEKTT